MNLKEKKLMGTVIKNVKIINEGEILERDLLIEGEYISKIDKNIVNNHVLVDAKENYLNSGVIDDQVHFREPGLTHKATIFFRNLELPLLEELHLTWKCRNTNPQTLTQELLKEKIEIAKKTSLANFSFFFGASNNNIEEVLKVDFKTCPGLKIFMGSSTGNMLVDDFSTLNNIFSKCNGLIATHCEDELTVRNNIEIAKRVW